MLRQSVLCTHSVDFGASVYWFGDSASGYLISIREFRALLFPRLGMRGLDGGQDMVRQVRSVLFLPAGCKVISVRDYSPTAL